MISIIPFYLIFNFSFKKTHANFYLVDYTTFYFIFNCLLKKNHANFYLLDYTTFYSTFIFLLKKNRANFYLLDYITMLQYHNKKAIWKLYGFLHSTSITIKNFFTFFFTKYKNEWKEHKF